MTCGECLPRHEPSSRSPHYPKCVRPSRKGANSTDFRAVASSCPITGESFPAEVNGGGGGNRTPVPKSFQCGFYEHSPSFDLTFRAPGTGSRTARPLFGSPRCPWPRLRGYPALWPPALTSREEGLAEGLLIRQPERSYRSQLKVFPGV